MALIRFAYLSRKKGNFVCQDREKLASKPVLKQKYNEILEEYLTLGHMSLADHSNSTKYFMPHHGNQRRVNKHPAQGSI